MDDQKFQDGKHEAQIQALFSAVERIEASQDKMRDDLAGEFRTSIEPIRKAVLGNGTPRQGLAAMVGVHDKIIKWQMGILSGLALTAIASFILGR